MGSVEDGPAPPEGVVMLDGWHFPARPDAPPGYRYVPGGGLYDLEPEDGQ